MERKSMGSFISALRKANGFTQKDLAEKLNVSDKTISRWERDESSPDLSIIPVIAELFNITCDELLCGEKKTNQELQSPRKDKQIKRILDNAIHKFKNSSYITIAIMLVGFIISLIANFGFYEGRIGFFIGVIFLVLASVHQCISSNNTFYAIQQEEFNENLLREYKQKQFDLNKIISVIILSFFVVLMPLITVLTASNQGLGIEYFAFALLIFFAVMVGYYFVIDGLFTAFAVKKGIYIKDNAILQKLKLQKVKNTSVKISVIVCAITFIIQIIYIGTCSGATFAEYKTFTDLDEYVEYMQTKTSIKTDEQVGMAPVDDTATYFDKNGNVITKEEALTKTIEDSDGNVILTYIHWNEKVVHQKYSYENGKLSKIRTYTNDDMLKGWKTYDLYFNLLNFGYLIAIVVGLGYYIIKYKK